MSSSGRRIEPSSPGSKPGSLPLADPRMFQECPAGIEPASPAWKAGTSAARPRAHKAEGEGVEPSRLIARLFSRQLPSPIGLPFRITSCGGRNRTCVGALNSRLPVPARAPPQSKSGTAGFEPTISCSRSTRNSRLSHTPECKSTQRESNPHFRHGKAAGCRYIMGAFESLIELSKSKSTGRDSNPRRRITGAESSPLDDQCLSVSGTRGTRTLTCRLRARYAAANTLIPCLFRSVAVGAEGIEPSTWSYKRPALTAELRASSRVGPEGLEPSPCRIKSPVCCRYTTTPMRSGVCVCSRVRLPLRLLLVGCSSSVVALRIELSATRLSAEYGQPALDYRSFDSRDGRSRTDSLVLPKHAGLPLPYIPLFLFSVARVGIEPISPP